MRVKTLRTSTSALLSTVVLMAGCFGGAPAPDSCSIEVVGLDELKRSDQGIDVAYRVRGSAGSPAETWLVARVSADKYLPGGGVKVGPGPFEAIIELKLTGMPRGFVAVLEVAEKRCRAEAPLPIE